MADSPAAKLLRWYDQHARTLPWRETPGSGETADPYRVWLSEIMLQQTTTTAVAPYYSRFLARWPDVRALAEALDAEVMSAWAGLGYYARARNLLACARIVVADHGGHFPRTEAALRSLPGIGAYTAAAITAIAFDQRAVVIDGNIERVVSRLRMIGTPLPKSRPEIREMADALTPFQRAGDFAQAMMDLGATICTPTRPACMLCPLAGDCLARAAGHPEQLPRKMPKAPRPAREGVSFVAMRIDGALLLRTRAAKGLLGGMTEFPSAWPTENPIGALTDAPLAAAWRNAGRAVHGFTHFDLTLSVYCADIPLSMAAPDGMRWVLPNAIHQEALPTLMRKVARAADLELAGKISRSGEPEQEHGSPRAPVAPRTGSRRSPKGAQSRSGLAQGTSVDPSVLARASAR